MPSTTDGIVLIAQIHGIGASATDNLIQLVNSSSGIEVAAIGAQIVSIIPMGPISVVTNGVAMSLVGVKIVETGGTTSLGDAMNMAGNVAAIAGALAAAASLPALATVITVIGVGLAVGGIVTTLYEKSNNLQITIDINGNFLSAANWRPPARDPLAIDLDGDGIETLGIAATDPILFDHNADGIRTSTGWLRPDDAWLVLDRNGNGTIDSGRELFGVDTVLSGTPGLDASYASTGFEALRALDSNLDNLFDAQDAAFTQVRLWQDANADGVSQAGELFTLADKGIASISLTETTTSTNLGNGNTVTGTATVTRSDGSTTLAETVSVATDTSAANLTLANNPFYREFTDATLVSSFDSCLAGNDAGWREAA